MRARTFLVLLAALLPLAFLAGWLASRGAGPGGPGERKVLYWVDPMNPSFRSPEPGTAPCGMPLEPVYADGPAPAAGGAAVPGGVAVRADRLQLIGVARERVRRDVQRHSLRLVGTVAPDETRLFRIAAATPGRVREMGEATTGSLVAAGEVLAAYYSQEVLIPQQNYVRILEAYRMLRKTGSNPYDNMQGGGQLAAYEKNLQTTRQTLLNLGLTPEQIEEIGMRGQPATLVQIRAPAAGFVAARNVTLGQSFDDGEELYVIADLGRVWVLADAFEGQEEYFRPGMEAVVTLAGSGRRFAAVVSGVPPRFDPATRTLKVRLEAVNAGYQLRPDMFVDVELPVTLGPGIFLPKEAVLDSGTRRVVFVEEGEGVFVPRAVRTGRRLGERVEIVGGLMEGETVVTSGNFLLDSESRMRAAGASAGAAALDPICGMEVEEGKARASGLVSEHGGKAWFFCTPGCKQTFDRDPKPAAARVPGPPGRAPETAPEGAEPAPAAPGEVQPERGHDGGHGAGRGMSGGDEPGAAMSLPDAGFKRDWAREGQSMPDPVDPVCGMEVDEPAALAAGLASRHEGRTWFFCTPECKQAFEKDPDTYVQSRR